MRYTILVFLFGFLISIKSKGQVRDVIAFSATKPKRDEKCFSNAELEKIYLTYNNKELTTNIAFVYRIYPLVSSKKKKCLGLYGYEYWIMEGKKKLPPSSSMPYYPILITMESQMMFYSPKMQERENTYREFVKSNQSYFTESQLNTIRYYFVERPPKSLHAYP